MFTHLQKILPKHRLSRLLGALADSSTSWIRRPLIHTFAAYYGISLAEAKRTQLDDYLSFNDFFTRELATDARPLPTPQNLLVSPVDGSLSQCGEIQSDALYQAKNKRYSLQTLLGNDPVSRTLAGGWFSTLYLAPADYHRVHMPFAGRLLRYSTIPGELFSVSAASTESIAELFCRNERLVCIFDTSAGPMAVILVGAMIVASIETVWGEPSSPYRRFVTVDKSQQQSCKYNLQRGDELARFRMGSTVILCLPPGRIIPSKSLHPGQPMRLGTVLGRLT